MPEPAATTGSSPRVRGTHRGQDGLFRAQRFIPAGAGNATRSARIAMLVPVHPRGCGERLARDIRDVVEHGSSPRVRGTQDGHRFQVRNHRFIPAGAGNAPAGMALGDMNTVHPRGCGERHPATRHVRGDIGSSPRVRGTHRIGKPLLAIERFIPAGAGNALIAHCSLVGFPVHLRGCGERAAAHAAVVGRIGSSPRVRGTPRCVRVGCLELRFIPAGAGNARSSSGRCPRSTVHPRGCGERAGHHAKRPPLPGSSPRVRGTRENSPLSSSIGRFIPAGAGNASDRTSSHRPPPVHPRGCGERVTSSLSSMADTGSSPRVRGTHDCASGPVISRRFIPAGAGNAF